MCVKDAEQVGEEMGNFGDNSNSNGDEEKKQCEAIMNNTQIQNFDFKSPFPSSAQRSFVASSVPLESICEDKVVLERQSPVNFVPVLRSGEWSDIGRRPYMEDTHICIANLSEKFRSDLLKNEAISFYGVFDGHGGEAAALFARDHLPRIIAEDAGFPLELDKVVTRSFLETDTRFAKQCSLEPSLSSGTTALCAMIFGRSLLVANAGDCRAVLSRRGRATELSRDHRPCCSRERARVEKLGGVVDEDYLNGQLGVTRALGDWHIEGMKRTTGDGVHEGGPLSAEPELRLVMLTGDDEFLIIGTDGVWEFFSNQNAVDFVRRRLQDHNDVGLCCKEVVDEASRLGADDNLTVLIVTFHSDPPPPVVLERLQVRRSISAEGLHNLKSLLEG